MTVQTLDVISVNLWNILISLANLLLVFFICKKFLYKPVQKVLAARKQQVEDIYGAANADRAAASEMKQQYEQRMQTAREEADTLVRNATQTATRRGEQIVDEAKSEAAHLKQKAEEDIVMERRRMLDGVRSEIGDMAVSIATKVVGRTISSEDQDSLLAEFIGNVGDQQ